MISNVSVTHTHVYIYKEWLVIISFYFKEINLAGLKLKEIALRAFCGLEHLTTLFLHKNELRGPPELLPVKGTLETLVLSNNRISSFPPRYFYGFKELRAIKLDKNFLSILPNIGFVGQSLRTFNVFKNQIESLDSLLIQRDLLVLGMFQASRNNIKTLDVKIFGRTPIITYFSFAKNKLQHLDDFRPHLLNWNSTLRMPVLMDYNPWNCGPGLAWMLELKGIKGVTEAHMFCHSPACRSGRNILLLSLYHHTGVSCQWCLFIWHSTVYLTVYES